MDGLIFNDGWIAMDEDGEWYWYSEEPRIGDDCWHSSGMEEFLSSYCFKNLSKVTDWKESKQKVGNLGNLGRL